MNTINPNSIIPQNSESSEAMSDNDGIDIFEYLRILQRHWLVIVLCVIVSLGITAFFTFRMTKIYRATTTVHIETQAPQVLGKNVEDVVEMGSGGLWSNREYYETQHQIIESRKIALKVVNEFNLNENIDFMGWSKKRMPAKKEDAAILLQSRLTVSPVQDSRLVNVSIDDKDPQKAKLYADAVSKAYVNLNLDNMHHRTLEAVDWLSERLDNANGQLEAAETKLFKYKKDNNILSISLEDRQSYITAQMQTAAQKLIEAKAKRIELQSKKTAVSQVANVKNPMAIPIDALNNNQLIQNLKQDYATLSQDYGELSARYGEKFPKMVEIKAKMDRITTDIKREVANVIKAIDAELHEAKLTEIGLKKALASLEADAQKLADKRGDYNILERNFENTEQVYKLLTGRSEEANLAKYLKVNNVEILDYALVPEHSIKPRVMMNLAVAVFLGLILGVVLSILLELSDRTIKTQEDLEKFGITFLGIVPAINSGDAGSGYKYGRKKRKKHRAPKMPAGSISYDTFVHENPKSQVAESLRSVRTNLQFMTADARIGSLLVTSPSPQEGKTTVAANLAIIMAQSGLKVIIVDTDMRRPRVHKAFKISRPSKGISTMILGETVLHDSVVHTDIPNLDVLPCGPTPPNPSELLHTAAFSKIMNEISNNYDRVIFDSPPVGIVTDAAIVSKMVDGTLLIVKSLKTTKDSVGHAVSVLRDINANILGTVLNGLDLNNKKYGKYYYYYYNKYGSYYGEDSKDTAKDEA